MGCGRKCVVGCRDPFLVLPCLLRTCARCARPCHNFLCFSSSLHVACGTHVFNRPPPLFRSPRCILLLPLAGDGGCRVCHACRGLRPRRRLPCNECCLRDTIDSNGVVAANMGVNFVLSAIKKLTDRSMSRPAIPL